MKFTSILTQIILEAAETIDHLINSYTKAKKKADGTKKKPKLTVAELANLIAIDPESDMADIDLSNPKEEDLKDVKPGGYTSWIIKQYIGLGQNTEIPYGQRGYDEELKEKKELFFEDGYKLTDDLKKLSRFKTRLPLEKRNIHNLTRDELYDLVKGFSLEKIKGSKKEKEEAATTYDYPGSEVVFRGPNWTVVKISENSPLAKSAACFFGGYHAGSSAGETNWCTSSPGYNWFENYIQKGPLFVILPTKWEGTLGQKSNLPALRYQFHFESSQFMNVDDRQIDLINFLNGEGEELKEYFKPWFVSGLVAQNGEVFKVDEFDRGAIGKFIALYGLEELFDSLPTTLTEFYIINKDRNKNIKVSIPPSIGKFKKLETLILDNCIDHLPKEICELKNIKFMSLNNNPQLKEIPDCLQNLKNMAMLALQGSPNVKIPDWLRKKGRPFREDQTNGSVWDLDYED